ncbi:MAG TPA: fibronectin type III domain-containing protein [Acidimicrobiales bacterium]|jgi:prepilin-type N-terminal cleavage/methylation domain-containing protein|nr:fibronectin type III domain-containing protein [Acidimicrobiales bacterium]
MDRFVCRKCSDEGFTLVELVVALTILAVGIVGVIGVTNSGFRVASAATLKSKMVANATKEIEALRAIPYNEIADGYIDQPRTDNGVTYQLQRAITTAPGNDKHKVVTVAVIWTEAGRVNEVRQASYLYPGGVGLATAGSTTTVVSNCTPDAPSSLTVAQVLSGTALQAATSLDLSWTISTTGCPVASYVIQYKALTSSTWSEVTRLATSREWRVTGLVASTTYQFQVLAKAPGGKLSTPSPMVTASTAAMIGANCTIGTITVTPSAVKKINGSPTGNIEAAPVVAMPVNGTCASFDIVYKKILAGSTITAQMTVANGVNTATATAQGPWDVGSRFVDVVERSSRTKVGSVLLVVCEHNVKDCS